MRCRANIEHTILLNDSPMSEVIGPYVVVAEMRQGMLMR